MASMLEAVMLICFGLSWPINAYKGYKARTARGTSWQFIALITLGYLAGIAAKFAGDAINWVLVVYFLNLACLGINWAVYFRNRRLDAETMCERMHDMSREEYARSTHEKRIRERADEERAHAEGFAAQGHIAAVLDRAEEISHEDE